MGRKNVGTLRVHRNIQAFNPRKASLQGQNSELQIMIEARVLKPYQQQPSAHPQVMLIVTGTTLPLPLSVAGMLSRHGV
jgi:hypothetical protein